MVHVVGASLGVYSLLPAVEGREGKYSRAERGREKGEGER